MNDTPIVRGEWTRSAAASRDWRWIDVRPKELRTRHLLAGSSGCPLLAPLSIDQRDEEVRDTGNPNLAEF